MKTRTISVAAILLVFLISACSANGTPTEEILSDIYTAAASTLSAHEMVMTPTPTSTTLVTATPFALPTITRITLRAQNVVVSYSAASTVNGCDDAAYVSNATIADGIVLAPGESFTKTWEFQNSGTCAWNEDYLITFANGTDMDGETTEIDQDVAVGTAGDTGRTICSFQNAWLFILNN